MFTRRQFFRRALLGGAGLTTAAGTGTSYGFYEAAHLGVVRQTVKVPNLPGAFAGKTVAVVADLHHGPFVGLPFIREAVRLTNGLKPDLVALVGDFAGRVKKTDVDLPPCL